MINVTCSKIKRGGHTEINAKTLIFAQQVQHGKFCAIFKQWQFQRNKRQDRQYVYNVILRHVWVNVVAVEKKKVLHISACACVCLVGWAGARARACVCARVALFIQHATRMRHIVICGLSGCTIFFWRFLMDGSIFGKKGTEHKICVDFLYNFCLKHFSRNVSQSKKNSARYFHKC